MGRSINSRCYLLASPASSLLAAATSGTTQAASDREPQAKAKVNGMLGFGGRNRRGLSHFGSTETCLSNACSHAVPLTFAPDVVRREWRAGSVKARPPRLLPSCTPLPEVD